MKKYRDNKLIITQEIKDLKYLGNNRTKEVEYTRIWSLERDSVTSVEGWISPEGDKELFVCYFLQGEERRVRITPELVAIIADKLKNFKKTGQSKIVEEIEICSDINVKELKEE